MHTATELLIMTSRSLSLNEVMALLEGSQEGDMDDRMEVVTQVAMMILTHRSWEMYLRMKKTGMVCKVDFNTTSLQLNFLLDCDDADDPLEDGSDDDLDAEYLYDEEADERVEIEGVSYVTLYGKTRHNAVTTNI